MNLTPIVLTFHVLIVLALIGVVLLQRSEGGALGIGGGGGGFMSGRGAANALTRLTAVLATLFFATSLGLAIFADQGETDINILNETVGEDGTTAPGDALSAEDLQRSIDFGSQTRPQTPSDPLADPLAGAIEEPAVKPADEPSPVPSDDDPEDSEPDPNK